MSLHPQSIKPIPPLTKEVAHLAFPKGNQNKTLRDKLGTFYNDEDFAELYSLEGQPALRPWQLALVCVMQYMANLSDREAAEAVAGRIDWKYALGLELSDSGWDFSQMSLFRSRLLNGSKEKLLLDKLLERCQQLELLKARGKARTDSTHITAAIRNLNRLECVGETLRAALNALAVVAPSWLLNVVEKDWFDRYSQAVEESRLPRGTEARYGNKRHTTWIGYKVHLTETCDKNQVQLITNVQTTPAHLADVDQTESIHQSLANKELLPKHHLADAGYVDGTLLVSSKQKYGLELMGPVRGNVSWQLHLP